MDLDRNSGGCRDPLGNIVDGDGTRIRPCRFLKKKSREDLLDASLLSDIPKPNDIGGGEKPWSLMVANRLLFCRTIDRIGKIPVSFVIRGIDFLVRDI